MLTLFQKFLSRFQRAKNTLLALVAFLFWLAYTLVNLSRVFATMNGMSSELSEVMLPILLSSFVLFTGLFFRTQVDKARRLNLMDLLNRLVGTGGVALIMAAMSYGVYSIFSDNRIIQNPLFINLLYDVNLGASLLYLIAAFSIFKKLVLFQKTKSLIFTWSLFEAGLFLSLLGYFFRIDFFSQTYLFYLATFGLLSIYLSANLKWIAYLSFKEKWKTILYMVLGGGYLYIFLNLLAAFRNPYLELDLADGIFFGSLFNFVGLYGLFTFLVTLFNLPTSSVFEQKVREAINIQKLSGSIQEQKTEQEIYQMFFNSSVSVVFADAAFLEVRVDKKNYQVIQSENLSTAEIQEIKARWDLLRKEKLSKNPETDTRELVRLNKRFKHGLFNSALEQCLMVRGEEVARLYLMKEVSDGFNDEMQEILTTFANQTSISIENIRLIHETVKNERYQREIKIARQVQKALLPQELPQTRNFSLSALYHTADEVGGDYYDIFIKNEDLCAIVIADVSGKGTSAAFHMAQLKGIFQSLSELEMDPATFLSLANSALSRGLDPKSFVTATYNLIDSRSKTIWTGRAGHCPTLMYHANERKAKFYLSKGIGLGMIRSQNGGFERLIKTEQIPYETNDILLLYTDGIIEARNELDEELGYETLGQWLEELAHLHPDEINNGIKNKLKAFCKDEFPSDDYTIVVLKFN
jgi:serine phosphatase RsbU (regulator of sigma subunit)